MIFQSKMWMDGMVLDDHSVMSEESWLYGDESEQCTSDSWSDIPNTQLLEQISQEVSASKGSTKAEVQLR